MSEPLILSPALKAALDERIEVWADLGRATRAKNDMITLADTVPPGNPGDSVGQLIDTANPPAEVVAVLSALRTDMDAISRLDADILKTTSEMKRLETRRQAMIVWGVIGGVILLIVALYVGASV